MNIDITTLLDNYTIKENLSYEERKQQIEEKILFLEEKKTKRKIIALTKQRTDLLKYEYDDIIEIESGIYDHFVESGSGGDIFQEKDEGELEKEAVSIEDLLIKMLEYQINHNAPDLHIYPRDKFFYTISMRKKTGDIRVIHQQIERRFLDKILLGLKNKAGVDPSKKIIEIKKTLTMKLVEDMDPYKFRISIITTPLGESYSIRKMPNAMNIEETLTFANLNYSEKAIAIIEHIQNEKNGMVLVTGETGSGKSLFLGSCIIDQSKRQKRILTIEDPVEMDMSKQGIVQIDLSLTEDAEPEYKNTIPKMKKAFLRHDPDICLLQEVRDQEETEGAFELATTGHLVYTTLHANDIASTMYRLMNFLNIPEDLLKQTIRGVVNQELIPLSCFVCEGEGRNKDTGEICNVCAGEGVIDRTPLYEVAYFGKISMTEPNLYDIPKFAKYYISKKDVLNELYENKYITKKIYDKYINR